MEIPLKVAELDHVVLRCRDQNRAFDFYTRILGLREERRIEQIGLIQLRAGRSMIDLVPATHPRAEDGLNVDHICLAVEARDLHEGRTLSPRAVGRGDWRACDALWRARPRALDLRARLGRQRRRAETDAPEVLKSLRRQRSRSGPLSAGVTPANVVELKQMTPTP